MVDGSLNYLLKLNAGGFINPMNTAQRAVGGMIGTVGKLAVAGGALAGVTAGIAGLGKALNLAANLESTSVAFRTLVGDAKRAEATIKSIKQLGASTPFEFPELATAARNLIAFGEAAEDVTDTVRRIGDVASGIQAPLGDIAEIYGKARVQGRLFMEDINQFQGRGIPIMDEFGKILGKSNEEIRKMVSDGEIGFEVLEQAFVALTSEGGRFFGMMDAQSKTMTGLLSTLKDNVNELYTKFGEPINNALKPVLEEAITLVESLGPAAEAAGKKVAGALEFGFAAIRSGELMNLLKSGFNVVVLEFANGIMKGVAASVATMKGGMEGVVEILKGGFDLIFGQQQMLNGFGEAFAAVLLKAGGVFMKEFGQQLRWAAIDFLSMMPDWTPGKAAGTEAAMRFNPGKMQDSMDAASVDAMKRGAGYVEEGGKAFADGMKKIVAGTGDVTGELAKNYREAKGGLEGDLEAARARQTETHIRIQAEADRSRAEREVVEKSSRPEVDFSASGDASMAGLGNSLAQPPKKEEEETEGPVSGSGGGGGGGMDGGFQDFSGTPQMTSHGPRMRDPETGRVMKGDRGTRSGVSALQARYNRMSDADKSKAGSFRDFVNQSPTDKGSISKRELAQINEGKLDESSNLSGRGAGGSEGGRMRDETGRVASGQRGTTSGVEALQDRYNRQSSADRNRKSFADFVNDSGTNKAGLSKQEIARINEGKIDENSPLERAREEMSANQASMDGKKGKDTGTGDPLAAISKEIAQIKTKVASTDASNTKIAAKLEGLLSA